MHYIKILPGDKVTVELRPRPRGAARIVKSETLMKVRASVKKICKDCKVIRRQGGSDSVQESSSQAEARLKAVPSADRPAEKPQR
jgi:hypothetical protein